MYFDNRDLERAGEEAVKFNNNVAHSIRTIFWDAIKEAQQQGFVDIITDIIFDQDQGICATVSFTKSTHDPSALSLKKNYEHYTCRVHSPYFTSTFISYTADFRLDLYISRQYYWYPDGTMAKVPE